MKSTRHLKRFGVVMALALFSIGLLATAAMADGPTATSDSSQATIGAGTLNIATPLEAGTFTGTLTGGAAQSLEGADFSASPSFKVTDATGTGHGWTVSLLATQFENTAGKQLPPLSLSAPQFTVAAVGTSSDITADQPAAAAIDTGAAGVIMADTTAPGDGMGTYTFTAPSSSWHLALLANAYAGTYHSTITTTLASAL